MVDDAKGHTLFFALFIIGVLLVTINARGEQCPNGNCPRQAPVAQPAGQPDQNFGIDCKRIKTGLHTINGRLVTEAEASNAIGSSLPDDKDLPFLTIIGPLSARKRVLADLSTHPILSRLRSRWRVQDYGPDEWGVKPSGFVLTGNPTIYLQTPTGAVLHRQDSYGGPDELVAALRQADHDYRPEADPNLTSPGPLQLAKKIPPWGYLAGIGGMALSYLWYRRKK